MVLVLNIYIKITLKKETQAAPHPTSASPPMSLRGESMSPLLKPTSSWGRQVSLCLGHLQSFSISLGRLTCLHGERYDLLCLPSSLPRFIRNTEKRCWVVTGDRLGGQQESPMNILVFVSWASVADKQKWEGLKQQKCVLLWFWMLEIQN